MRNKLDNTTDTQEQLKTICNAQANCQKLIEIIGQTQRNINEHNKTAHKYQNKTDGKKTTQFLSDYRKNKITFPYRNILWHSLIQTHAKPSACSDGKQWLSNLISGIVIIAPRILPGNNSSFDMIKQMISNNRSTGSCSKAHKWPHGSTCCHVKHHNIRNKENNCRTKVFLNNKHQHMHSRQSGGEHNLLQTGVFIQHSCYKKHKNNLC